MQDNYQDLLVDITMTAVKRPEILKKTLHSFFRNCFAPIADRCRLIINVDPIGDPVCAEKMMEIVSGYFRRFYVNFPATPSFPKAFLWTWDKVRAPWAFHLEDDWELRIPVNILDMIKMMEDYPQLASLRLPFFRSEETYMKNWNLRFPWNGSYFECPGNLRQTAGFAGHPSLLRGRFVHECAELIDINLNPEKQFHGDNDFLVNEVLHWEYGVWGKPNSPAMINDIGTEWKARNKFQKAGSKAFFTQWEKIS